MTNVTLDITFALKAIRILLNSVSYWVGVLIYQINYGGIVKED
jgi:hypothetical protein